MPGEGEPDYREPEQKYDERGRPYNPASRIINRSVVRTHNEVMQVIGVAEDNGAADAALEAAMLHEVWEEETGLRLLLAGRFLQVAGFWGINGTRQRILVRSAIPCPNSAKGTCAADTESRQLVV